jgi:hypothetical protein
VTVKFHPNIYYFEEAAKKIRQRCKKQKEEK